MNSQSLFSSNNILSSISPKELWKPLYTNNTHKLNITLILSPSKTTSPSKNSDYFASSAAVLGKILKNYSYLKSYADVKFEYELKHLHYIKIERQEIWEILSIISCQSLNLLNFDGKLVVKTSSVEINRKSWTEFSFMSISQSLSEIDVSKAFDDSIPDKNQKTTLFNLAFVKKLIVKYGGDISIYESKPDVKLNRTIEVKFTLPSYTAFEDENMIRFFSKFVLP
jgi:hypothetical protein